MSSLINTQPSVAGHGDTETGGRQEADLSTEGREGACTAALHGGNGQRVRWWISFYVEMSQNISS